MANEVVDCPSKVVSAPKGDAKDTPDDQGSRWNRDRHEGFVVGQYHNPPPMLFTEDHHNVWLQDIYRGCSAFLICSGPSFAKLNHDLLRQPCILTMGLNNSPKSFRPNMWCEVDSPDHFMRSIWLDPKIMKFAPICHATKPIFHNQAWRWLAHSNKKPWRVGECPNVIYYRRNEHFQAKQFLTEDTINWGNHKKYGGGRTVMLPAIRILYILGVRRIFLLGCDFKMEEGKSNYHFEQKRERGSVKGNNSTYAMMEQRFGELKPHFKKAGLEVYNCNPDSALKAFDKVPYEEAIQAVLSESGNIDIANERTSGLYDEAKPDDKGVCCDLKGNKL